MSPVRATRFPNCDYRSSACWSTFGGRAAATIRASGSRRAHRQTLRLQPFGSRPPVERKRYSPMKAPAATITHGPRPMPSTMTTMLFCNIARMDSYRGWTSVDRPQGAGNHPKKEEVHNFHPHGGHVYGYVAAVARSISLERLGAADKMQPSVGGVDVIWTAPSTSRGRDVVGWYRDATVFRHLQTYRRGHYHAKASKTNFVLLPSSCPRTGARSTSKEPGISQAGSATATFGMRTRSTVSALASASCGFSAMLGARSSTAMNSRTRQMPSRRSPVHREASEIPLAADGQSPSSVATPRFSAGFSNAPTVIASCAAS